MLLGLDTIISTFCLDTVETTNLWRCQWKVFNMSYWFGFPRFSIWNCVKYCFPWSHSIWRSDCQKCVARDNLRGKQGMQACKHRCNKAFSLNFHETMQMYVFTHLYIPVDPCPYIYITLAKDTILDFNYMIFTV
jgi:hypothetical protein